MKQTHLRRHCDIVRERESKLIALDSSEEAIGDVAPPTTAKVRKLVLLKVPYAELQPYRQKLVELHLDFLLWDWNCVSATICKEMVDNNRNEGYDLRGNPMLWTIDHWTKVIGPCAG